MTLADDDRTPPAGEPNESRPPLADHLHQARQGAAEQIGNLIDASRDYLVLMANREMLEGLRSKFSPSDIVQETCVRAFERFEQFQGQCEEEWLAWLRQILLRQIGTLRRRYVEAEIRNVRRETELSAAGHMATDSDTPSRRATVKESVTRIERAMARLPGDYQLVLQLREWELLSFQEIGRQMGRSEEAARQLWYRALDRLSLEFMHGDRPQ